MNTIKFSKTSRTLKINGAKFRGFDLTNLPTKFAYIYDEINDSDGVRRWFNYKGLTWIKNSEL